MKLFSKIGEFFGNTPKSQQPKANGNSKRSFEATQVNRLTKDFVEASESINAAIRAGGARLRKLSRQMYENDATARRWVDLFVINVVGANGHSLQSDIKVLEEQAMENGKSEVIEVSDDEKNNLIEKHFEEWSKAENCSVTRVHSYPTIQKILARHKARDGEAFLRRVVDPESKYGLRLQVIPPELIPESYNAELPNGNVVVMGIEYDVWRRPVTYYVLKNTVKQDAWGFNNTQGEMEPVPAKDMIHWYDPDFSNQSRGFTRMANVILMMTWKKDYNRAHILNAKFGARKLGFLTDLNPDDPNDVIKSDTNETTETESLNGATSQSTSRPSISGEELTFTSIGNQKLEKWDPSFPQQENEMVNRTIDRYCATGLNVAYCSLSGDYSNSTWSSARTELDIERNGWKHEQQLMIDMVDMQVFTWWLELALMKRAIPGYTYRDFERLNHPYFYGPSFDYINPVDESNALRSDIEAQFISPYDVAAKKGKRLEDIYRDTASAARLRKKFNIPDPVYGKTSNVATGIDPAPAKPDAAAKPKPKNNGVKIEEE